MRVTDSFHRLGTSVMGSIFEGIYRKNGSGKVDGDTKENTEVGGREERRYSLEFRVSIGVSIVKIVNVIAS